MDCWVGIDAGGTFTDFVVITQKTLLTHKVLSTPAAPEQAILRGLTDLGLLAEGAPPLRVYHGSTIATNAALEGKGARTAFITNEGFQDILLLGRQAREFLYDLTPPPSQRVFKNTRFFGVQTRRDATGKLLTPLTEAALEKLRSELDAWQPESVAVNLLFSYVDKTEELTLEKLSPPDALVTLSSELLPRHGEYERGVAVWLNAWLGPLVNKYLLRLQQMLDSTSCSVMQSSGLMMSAEQAASRAVHLLLSGPAGGVVAADYMGRRHQQPSLLTFDMGGTSTDISLVVDGPALTDKGAIGPYPVAVPMVDIHTIGAGGGSLASIDEAGMLRVGPESAGADPGPACYGQNGTQPTVTDANLYLGYLIPERFLGGRMLLYPELAEAALTRLGESLGMTPEQVALGIVRIANEHMTQALRMVTLEQGQDARIFTLCCFGGAGGLHLCALAENLGITRAMVPEHSAVLSAFGMLVSPLGSELGYSIQRPLSEWSDAQIEARFTKLLNQGVATLLAEGVPAEQIQRHCLLELRYQGQSHAIKIPWSNQNEAAQAFEANHLKLYGFNLDRTIELVAVRASLLGPVRQLATIEITANDQTQVSMQPTSYSNTKNLGTVPVFERTELQLDQPIEGPAIIAEEMSTTLVSSGWTCSKSSDGCLWLTQADNGYSAQSAEYPPKAI